jgi:hypothetical protein
MCLTSEWKIDHAYEDYCQKVFWHSGINQIL